ncbi:leucine-rich repeat domain-containing protein [Clostridium perfringens]|uniref:leucine-rich repeat domain-containing protein n=1 Tax=Clostridium perfringens TaxID=1502 RepID=UPI00189735A7|nr:leucine-rich repeat domain-containing protein [Clostridium perfringens]
MKKNKIENLLHSKGYVSIETLIVAGLLIATGAFLISKLVWKGKDVAISNDNNMINAGKTMDDNSFVEGSANLHNQTIASNSQLPTKDDFACDLKNPSNLNDYEYAIIDDNYINGELKKIDEKIKNRPDMQPKFINNLKAPIQKLKEFKGGVVITGYCGNKTDIEIPSCIDGKKVLAIGNPSIGKPVFDEKKLKSVKLPNTLKYIGCYAFSYNNLTNIAIPDSVVTIDNFAFDGNNLTSIKFGSNLKRIGDFAFDGNQLESVIIPDSVVEIGECAFICNKLTSIKLGSNLKKIGESAFSTNKLESVIVPDNVTYLGYDVFEYNPLKKKIIPKNCEESKIPTLKAHK